MFKKYFWLYLTIGLLVASGTLATIPMAKAQTPTIFIDPPTVVGNLTPSPGSLTTWDVNVTDIGPPGMIGHEFYLALDPKAFPEYKPSMTNQNFTADASGWTATVTGSAGPYVNGYYAADGNPAPGSGPGSYRMRVNSTGSAIGSRTLVLEQAQSFTWNVGGPPDGGVLVSFAYAISGNAFGSVTLSFRVVKPDLTVSTITSSKTFTSAKPWSYNVTTGLSIAFTQKGTYKFQVRSALTTAGTAATNYVEIKYDDLGLTLAPISVSEGPFLTSDPRNVGKTYWTAKYMKFPTNNSLYISDSLTGIPWTDVWPLQGGGKIASMTLLVNYGAAAVDLWGTKLLQPGLVPPYTPEPMAHATVDAYFNNKITGDIDGDGDVDGVDFGLFAPTYGRTGLPPHFPSDFDGDGDVDGVDFGLFAPNYGRHYP